MPYVAKRRQQAIDIPFMRAYARKVRGMGADTFDTSELGDLTSTLEPTIPTSIDSVGGNLANLTPVPTTTPSSGGFNLTSLFNALTSAAVAGQKIYLGTQQPSLVPGTQAIYNPATGQYYNPSTGQVVNPQGAALASIPFSSNGSLLLVGGLAIGAVVLISMLGGRR